MRVFWTSSAEQDRTDIIDFIGQDNPLAAVRMDELFATAAGRLAEHPLPGRAGQIPGTRELMPHESYQSSGGDAVDQAAGGIRSDSGRAGTDRTRWREPMIVMPKDKRWNRIEAQLRQPIASLD